MSAMRWSSVLKQAAVVVAFSCSSSVGLADTEYVPMTHSLVSIPMEEDSSAAERIGAAARMSTLAQQVPAAACHLKANVNQRESRALLKEARKQFPLLRDALLDGSFDLRINGGVTRPNTIDGIMEASAAWNTIDAAVEVLLQNAENPTAHKTIAADSQEILRTARHSLGLVTAESARPAELLLADAMLITIAGHQSMLSQKLSLEFCNLWSSENSEAAVSQIEETIKMFEANLNALRDGAPELGLKPVATRRMQALLEDVQAEWQSILPAIEAVVAYGDASDAMKTVVFDGLTAEMYKLERLVDLCVRYAKHNYS